MEKVKFNLLRILILTNILALIVLPRQIFNGADIAELIYIYKKSIFFINFISISGIIFLNNFLKGGFWFTTIGIAISPTVTWKKEIITWDQVTIDLKQKINPGPLGLNCKVEIKNPHSEKKIFMYINKFNEQSFIELTKKYVPPENDLYKAIKIYSEKRKIEL